MGSRSDRRQLNGFSLGKGNVKGHSTNGTLYSMCGEPGGDDAN